MSDSNEITGVYKAAEVSKANLTCDFMPMENKQSDHIFVI